MEFLSLFCTSFILFSDECFSVAFTKIKAVPLSVCLAVKRMKHSFKDSHVNSVTVSIG